MSKTSFFDTYSGMKLANYDNKRNVENLWTIYPFLQGYQFSKNNPGSIRFYRFDGNVEKEVPGRKTIRYEYLANGCPARRTEQSDNGSLLTTYNYTD
ncbi:hypothetical protein [Dyadobacter crusticola]|uniref:hypothetical protein n=1 Tax=Dyadobacter crusticola TaxID=292407 RepID=UPI000553C206|nr:hypothetical protein [Dyadobacter crusticola]